MAYQFVQHQEYLVADAESNSENILQQQGRGIWKRTAVALVIFVVAGLALTYERWPPAAIDANEGHKSQDDLSKLVQLADISGSTVYSCKKWCRENKKDWSVKCNWKRCGACSECNALAPLVLASNDIVTPAPLTPPPTEPSIVINDWNSMGNEIRFLSWNIQGEVRSDTGELVTKGCDLSKVGGGIYALGGAVQGVVDIASGEDVGASLLKMSKSFVPLIGMVNPLAGLCVGMTLSIFTPSKGSMMVDALTALYKEIMKEVAGMITADAVENQVNQASNTVKSILMVISTTPGYFDHEPETDDDKKDYYTWYLERASDIALALGDIFSPACVSGLSLAWPPNPECQGFAASGVLISQLQIAQLHVSLLQSAAQYGAYAPTGDESGTLAYRALVTASMYADFLAGSLTTWLSYPTTLTCSYDPLPDGWGDAQCYPHGGCASKCPNCVAQLSDASAAAYTYTGNTVSNFTGCATSCTVGSSQDQQSSADMCSNGCEGACTNANFQQITDQWKLQTRANMMPWVRALQVAFTAVANASGKQCGACPAGPYEEWVGLNASNCQVLCRSNVDCRAFQFNGLVEGKMDYNSDQEGTCSLFTCTYKGEGESCVTSDECAGNLDCYPGTGTCTTYGPCLAVASESDCVPIWRTNFTNRGHSCTTSDQCSGVDVWCRNGPKKCLTNADCDVLYPGQDCSIMLRNADGGAYTELKSRQMCTNITAAYEITIDVSPTILDINECAKQCGPFCNGFAIGTSCILYENCQPSVLLDLGSNAAFTAYLKNFPTTENASTACAWAVQQPTWVSV